MLTDISARNDPLICYVGGWLHWNRRLLAMGRWIPDILVRVSDGVRLRLHTRDLLACTVAETCSDVERHDGPHLP